MHDYSCHLHCIMQLIEVGDIAVQDQIPDRIADMPGHDGTLHFEQEGGLMGR